MTQSYNPAPKVNDEKSCVVFAVFRVHMSVCPSAVALSVHPSSVCVSRLWSWTKAGPAGPGSVPGSDFARKSSDPGPVVLMAVTPVPSSVKWLLIVLLWAGLGTVFIIVD